jgi:hypothetical protein
MAVRNVNQTAMTMRTGSMSRACRYSHAVGTSVRRRRMEIALLTGKAAGPAARTAATR